MTTANRRAKNNADRDLKQWLLQNGITQCEWPRGCTDRLGLAPAHRVKQRFITQDNIEEFHIAVLLCAHHHHYVEHGDNRKRRGTHRRMYRLVTMIYNRRGKPRKQKKWRR